MAPAFVNRRQSRVIPSKPTLSGCRCVSLNIHVRRAFATPQITR
ncbi:hypothetical protein RBWH47_03164 [Rhodopirellula baltica WH47]|uniref:Uncharacterized protein n=1 Tax=Rhodopirellula baltica WH47 TaxID=991778 RepID=F2B1H0_RHOBT|nr:hypothetical protein RBWH47_03164 [Rhodopirellula baltica WH47]